jgi:IS1 family transposase
MNKLSVARRSAIIRVLVEGNSVRSTARITGAAKATVLKLLVEVGEFCSVYQDHALRNLTTKRIEADEIWAFVGAKETNAKREGDGDIWTFTAIDADSKLMVSWLVGDRSAENAHSFMNDVAGRLANRVQLTTDGHKMYLTATEDAFGGDGADFAQIIKAYGTPEGVPAGRYSPAECSGIEKVPVFGKPDVALVSTPYFERQNLNMRMAMRRFTRLTNGFSKKAENHAHAVGLYFFFYNHCRPHQTLTKANGGIKQTPAMAAGVASQMWSLEDMLRVMDGETMIT